MTEYSDQELVTLLRGLESQWVKRKRSGRDRTGIRRNICAFANDQSGSAKPGVIFVGVEADGSPAGIDVDDRLLRRLARMRTDGAIHPFPRMSVEKKVLDGCELAVVTVQPSTDLPVRFQGRAWIKVGPTVQWATHWEERHLAERHGTVGLPFDYRPSTASLADLDQAHIERVYLPRAVAPRALGENQRTFGDQLHSLRLSTRGRPTQAALIAFGNDPLTWVPGAYVQFLRFDGDTRADPIRTRAKLSGRLDDVLRRLDQLIQINITTRMDPTLGPEEPKSPDYPLTAIQQLTNNAVMHRSYESSIAPVRLHWFSNRIEILSAGGLYGTVTSVSIGAGQTDYRNPLIAEIMDRLGFGQRIGRGLPLAKKAMEENGNPPLEFDFSPTHVMAKLRPAL